MPYRLKLDCPPGREVHRVIVELTTRALQCAGDPRTPLAQRVHFARTSCKKIRAALRLLRTSEPKMPRRANAWFRDTGRVLAELRDATVLPQTFRALVGATRREFTAVRRALEAQRRRAVRDAADHEQPLEDCVTRLRAAERRLAQWTPTLTVQDMVKAFRRSYRRARKARREAAAQATSDAFHAYRKSAKTQGYHCGLLRGAWPKVMHARQHELDALSDLLGEEHDLAVLAKWLETHAVAGEARRQRRNLARMIGVRRAALREDSLLLGARLFTDKPSLVGRRMLEWWHTANALAQEGREC